MPVTCIDIDGEASDVTADAASALAQKMADYHRKNIVYIETADGQHLLTVEGGALPGRSPQARLLPAQPEGLEADTSGAARPADYPGATEARGQLAARSSS